MPAARCIRQRRRRCLGAIYTPVEDALAVLLWRHGLGAVNDGKAAANLDSNKVRRASMRASRLPSSLVIMAASSSMDVGRGGGGGAGVFSSPGISDTRLLCLLLGLRP